MSLKVRLFFIILTFLLVLPAIVPAKDKLPGFSVGKPVIYKNLSIFPVEINGGSQNLDLQTLDEAVKKDYLKITEVNGGQVNKIALENTSKEWIFLLAGEIISGAKQNRIIGKDTLLPPKSGKVEELVFCVESGRWVMQSEKFSSYGLNASLNVRQTANQNENQSMVWSEVSNSTKISGKSNPTGKFDVVYDDKEVQNKIDDYMDIFSGFVKENRNATGVVVVVGDNIEGADIFGDRELFEKLWPKLLKSYSVDALMRDKIIESNIDKKDVEAFLEKFRNAKQEKDKTAVAGLRVEFSSKEVVGGILMDDNGRLVHYVQFPYKEVKEKPDDIYIQQNINLPNNQINAPENQLNHHEEQNK